MNNSDNQNKKKYILRFFICAVIFISVFVIINITTFKGLLSALFSVLLPILLGAVLAYMLNPILKLYEFKVFKRLKNKKVLRGLSILMTYITFALILCAFGAILIPSLITSIGDLTANAENYLITISDLINKAAVYVTGNPDHASLMTPGKLYELIMKIAKVFLPSSDDAVGIITGIGTVIKNILLAFFISLYMLISKERITAQFRKLVSAIFGNKGKKRLYRYLRLIRRTFGDYFIGMLFDALIVMCVSFILFAIFGIPYTPLVAVTIGITNIIPVFGPFIGAIPSFVLIFIAEPQKAIIFAILILIIQQIDGNIIAPKVLGNSTGISSLGVIIAITIMGSYFGIIGMIIGVPIFANAAIATAITIAEFRRRI